MSNEQKNEQKQKKTSLFSSRRLRHGGFATLLVVAVIVITILLNIVISTLDNVWGLSYDLSSNRSRRSAWSRPSTSRCTSTR